MYKTYEFELGIKHSLRAEWVSNKVHKDLEGYVEIHELQMI